MARRKKILPVPEPVVEAPQPPPEPVFVRKTLQRAELDALGRWAAEMRYSDLVAQIRAQELKALVAKLDPNGEIAAAEKKVAAARESELHARSRYKSAFASAGQRLGIELSDYGYDDETGLLSLLPKE